MADSLSRLDISDEMSKAQELSKPYLQQWFSQGYFEALSGDLYMPVAEWSDEDVKAVFNIGFVKGEMLNSIA